MSNSMQSSATPVKCFCKKCNKEFYKSHYKISRGEGKYCSKQCYWLDKKGKKSNRLSTRIERTCIYCDNKFTVTPSVTRKEYGGKYCSHKCHSLNLIGKKKDGAWAELKCQQCGKLFSVESSRKETAKYCSPECHMNAVRKIRIPSVCKNCGKQMITLVHRIKDGRGIFCSKKCLYNSRKGHISYRRGKTNKEIFGDARAEEMKRKFLIKQKIIWESPDYKEKKRKLILKQYKRGDFPKRVNTDIERIMKDELIKRGYIQNIDFFHQCPFGGRYIIDFVFPKQKILIECDGDFHHVNPSKYPYDPFTFINLKTGKKLNQIQIDNIKNDKEKTEFLSKAKNGSWKLFRFWGERIKKDVKGCVDEIENYLKRYKNQYQPLFST